jgi:biofilm PGA synthesis N-glycosyltransferase PgaC
MALPQPASPSKCRISLVVPFLNEEQHLPTLLESIAAQSRPPDEVLLVDDGSTDASAAIAGEFAATHAYAKLARRPKRDVGRDRLAGGSAVRAFVWGIGQLDDGWDVVGKLDADLRLNPLMVATLERALADDPELGITGAYLSIEENGVPVRHRCGPGHVDGATKLYRRACFEAIAPLPMLLNWDTIDEVRARLRGWKTAPVPIPGGDPLHLRPTGSHDGVLRGYRRRGVSAWCLGEPWLHVLLMGVQLFGDRPRGLTGVSYVLGWLGAAIRREPRAEREVLDEVRRDVLLRIRRRARLELAALARVG